MQPTHGVAAFVSLSKRPVAHGTHTVEAPAAYVPLPHAWHGVAALESVSALPTTQLVQLVDPAAA